MSWLDDSLKNRVIAFIERFDVDCSVDDLYDLVVEEYNESQDDPEEATANDIKEIYDASY